jgi:hypothetical protein
MKFAQMEKFENNALTILYRHKGAVYGGYIRDMIAGVFPKDIDVVLPKDTLSAFWKDLERAGYVSQGLQPNGAILFKKDGFLDVEAVSCDDTCLDIVNDGVFIGPEGTPDFDVNTLAYDGTKMYNWVDPGAGDLLTIIMHIQKREAETLDPGEDRIEKIKKKGYTII